MNAFERHGIEHLSASHINLFIAQPAMWAVSYLLKKKTPVGPAAHRGSAVEAGIEAGLFDPTMSVEECQSVASGMFHSLTRLSADERNEKERASVAPSVAIGLAELRKLGTPEKPEDGRQHKIEVEIEDIPVPFHGYLDLLYPQHGLIIDLKTTARIPSAISEAHARQGAIYAAARSNHAVKFAYVSSSKMAVHTLENVSDHLASVVRAAKAIEAFLELSDDAERLVRCFAPDMSSFYWGGQSARTLAQQVWG